MWYETKKIGLIKHKGKTYTAYIEFFNFCLAKTSFS